MFSVTEVQIRVVQINERHISITPTGFLSLLLWTRYNELLSIAQQHLLASSTDSEPKSKREKHIFSKNVQANLTF